MNIAKENLERLVIMNSNKVKIDPSTTPGFNYRKNYIEYYGYEPDEYWTFNPDDLYIKKYIYPDLITEHEETNEFGETVRKEVVHKGGLKEIVFALPLSNGQEAYAFWRIDRTNNKIGIINGKYLSLSEDFGYPQNTTNYVTCKTDGTLRFNFMFRTS